MQKLRRSLTAVLVAALFSTACDDKPSAPSQTTTQTAATPTPVAAGDDEITAEPAYRPMEIGSSIRVNLTSESVIPTPPTKKMRKKTGQLRAVDVQTKLHARFDATKVRRDQEVVEADAPRPESWDLSFELFEKVTERPDTPTVTTSHDIKERSFEVDVLDDEVEVRAAGEGMKATESQVRFATAIARDLTTRDEWGKFLASREFPQAKIVEVPEQMVLGRFGTAFFGPITEAHTTVALFRLAMEDDNEVAIFEINSRMKSLDERDGEEVVMDFEAKGKLVVRIVDGLLLRYDLESRVVPRNKAGAMLSSGSGSWKMALEVDADPVAKPE